MSATISENEKHWDYQSPLATRYASKEMRYNFSDQRKFSTWRRLWVYLAKAEMFEECGVCDEQGNVRITKTFVEPLRTKKTVARSRQKASDARANAQRASKVAHGVPRRERPIKGAAERMSKPSDSSKHPSDTIECPNCSLMKLVANRCEGKENQGHNLGRFLLYEDFKGNPSQRDDSNHVLPSISTYLNKGKRLKAVRWNDDQKYSNNFFVSSDSFHKSSSDCFCRCRLHSDNCFQWNPVDDLANNFSGSVNITDETESPKFRCFESRNGQILLQSDISSNEANCFTNFGPDFVEGGYKMAPTPFADQNSGYNFLEPSLLLQQQHFWQNFPRNDVKPLMTIQNSNWFSSAARLDQIHHEFPRIPCNNLNYRMIENRQQQNFNCTYENAINSENPMVYPINPVFGENKPWFD